MLVDFSKIRTDFPILSRTVHNKPLVYFDNGATTQKPQAVIDTVNRLYSFENSNIHRGVHFLSDHVTNQFEAARETVRNFINAEYLAEVIFTAGTTASINTVAFSFGEQFIKPGNEVLISAMEHHANIVPWQMMCQRKGAILKVIPFNQNGELNIDAFEKLLNPNTRLVAVTHVSNTLGTVNPIKHIISKAHQVGAKVLVDAAQSIQHIAIDVKELDCDFLVFSGHKIYGPTGIGVLYGKETLLREMPPYQGGGDMVDCVKFEHTTYNDLPFKFEAGTLHYVGAIALAEAIKYIQNIGIQNIAAYENKLLAYATEKLASIEGLTIYGTALNKGPIISFLLQNIHHYDTGMVLDKLGIAVRTGTHCNQPVMDIFKIEGTVRASICFYNNVEDIDKLYEGLVKVKQMFG